MAKKESESKIECDLIIENAYLVTVGGSSGAPKRRDQMDRLDIFRNGAVSIKNGLILGVGDTDSIKNTFTRSKKIINAHGKLVMPGLIDAHTHAIFGGSRAHEYESKIKGEIYANQHGQGRGIFYTVDKTREATEKELIENGLKILTKMLCYGTTTVEIKSGYGLDVENELKILRVIKSLKEIFKEKMSIVSTFLGAHAFPCSYFSSLSQARKDYVSLIVEKMIPAIKKEKLAEFCDVFCDNIAFNAKESLNILEVAHNNGFKLKAHIDQTSYSEGWRLINKLSLISVDHTDFTEAKFLKDDIFCVAVLLPGVTYHLMEMIHKQFWPEKVREFIDSGVAVALATDFNPGSCPCFSMQTIMELAARIFKMTPNQIINASTINAACALDRGDEIGSLEVGKKADIIICDVENHLGMINSFGTNKIDKVIKNGKIVVEN